MKDAVPTIFEGCPKYFSSSPTLRESPCQKKVRLDNKHLAISISESVKTKKEHEKKYMFSNCAGLLNCLNCIKVSEFWVKIIDERVMFMNIEYVPYPKINCSIIIDENLQISVFHKEIKLTKLGKYNFPFKIDNIFDVENILQIMENLYSLSTKKVNVNNILNLIEDALLLLSELIQDDDKLISLICEQIKFLKCKKFQRRYSPEFLILNTILHSISPHAYRFLYNSKYLIIPHPSTLKRLCAAYNIDPQNEQSDDNFLSYIKGKWPFLKDEDKTVILLIDEIHLKPFLDFKGGNLLGMDHSSEGVANSAHVFMIRSLTSSYKDVVHILPVKKITGEILYDLIKKIICGLEKIGFKVFCISSDNNAINRKAMSFFANPPKMSIVYCHPIDKSRPLFYVIDSVHLLKCIRNNWLNQKNSHTCMYFPVFEESMVDKTNNKLQAASLFTLRKIHQIESNEITKYCHTLTAKALSPTNIERQNVQLVVQIFNRSVIEGLKVVGPVYDLLNYESTAQYINVICTWWEIMNVGSLYKGERKKNVYQEPLTNSPNDEKIKFLNKFLDWLERWSCVDSDTGRLSKETHLALRQTTYALIEIVNYCTEKLNLNYVLTAKFQTDCLEGRFGLYRQIAGGHYNISVTQLFESEKKVRIRSLIPLTIASHEYGNIEIGSLDSFNNETEMNFDEKDSLEIFKITVNNDDLKNLKNIEIVLTYIAGYCAHACLKKIKCQFCKNYLVCDDIIDLLSPSDSQDFILIRNMDRGGLNYPCEEIIIIIKYTYVVVTKLLSKEFEKNFIRAHNHRSLVHNIVLHFLISSEVYLPFDVCHNDHKAKDIITYIIKPAINIFLKNYCKRINDSIVLSSQNKKRKIQTLKN